MEDIVSAQPQIPRMEPDVLPPKAADQQHRKTDDLAADRGNGRAAHTHAEHKNQKRVKGDVHDGAAHQPDHGIEGAALKTKLIVDDALAHHKGRADQNDAQIRKRIGKRGIRRAQKPCQRGREEIAENRRAQPKDQRHGKTRDCDFVGLLPVSGPEQAGQIVAGALAAEEAQGLDDSHYRKHQPHSRGALGGDAPDKIGVRRVVDRCYQHADNGGRGKRTNQLWDRRLGQISTPILLLPRAFHRSLSSLAGQGHSVC